MPGNVRSMPIGNAIERETVRLAEIHIREQNRDFLSP